MSMDLQEYITSKCQHHLIRALNYFLYDSLLTRPARAGRLEKDRLSPFLPLLTVETYRRCNIEPPAEPADLRKENVGAAEYAEALAGLYRTWGDNIPETDSPEKHIPLGMNFGRWLDSGGNRRRFHPVARLRELMKKKGSRFFLRALLHGSAATLDGTAGFSDLDLAFIVRPEILKSRDGLLGLREIAADVFTHTLSFDPFMHHGPYYISGIDLSWYPESYFPVTLFSSGVDLLDKNDDLKIIENNRNETAFHLINNFESLFDKIDYGFIFNDIFNMQWIFGSVMLLPALYLQIKTGKYRYKKDTFPAARPDFTASEWRPVEEASIVRAELGPKPQPPQWLIRKALRLKNPVLLQRWGRNHPLNKVRTRRARSMISPTFVDDAIRLIKSMRLKTKDAAPDGKAAPLTVRSCLNDVFSGGTADEPVEIDREFYEQATEKIVGRWTNLAEKPVSIYRVGSVGAPGVSDLDFIAVFSDDARIDWKNYVPEAFDGEVRSVFTHAPYLCTETSFSELPYWYPAFDLERLRGKDLPVPELPENHVRGVMLGHMTDYLFAKIPVDLLRLAWEKPVRVRTVLCIIHSLKYTFMAAETAGISVGGEYRAFAGKVDRFRGSWFKRKRGRLKKLNELLIEAVELSGVLLSRVDSTLRSNIGEENVNDIAAKIRSSHVFRFSRMWDFNRAVLRAFLDRIDGNVSFEYPASLAAVLSFYGAASHEMGRHLERLGIPPSTLWDGGRWRDGLVRHANALATYGESAANLGVPPQMYVALGYSPEKEKLRQGFSVPGKIRTAAKNSLYTLFR